MRKCYWFSQKMKADLRNNSMKLLSNLFHDCIYEIFPSAQDSNSRLATLCYAAGGHSWKLCVKVKVTLTDPKAQRGGRGIALLFPDLGARRGWVVSTHAPAALPPGKTRYPLYRRLGGPQSRSGRVRKISPPPGFDPQTVQPVASRYTD
jgi:hypothetical protein